MVTGIGLNSPEEMEGKSEVIDAPDELKNLSVV